MIYYNIREQSWESERASPTARSII